MKVSSSARMPHLAVGIHRKYRMNHIAFRGPTGTTAPAYRAFSLALSVRLNHVSFAGAEGGANRAGAPALLS
eukprot:8742211-Pyramimonas_sp.AAC.2